MPPLPPLYLGSFRWRQQHDFAFRATARDDKHIFPTLQAQTDDNQIQFWHKRLSGSGTGPWTVWDSWFGTVERQEDWMVGVVLGLFEQDLSLNKT